MQRLTDLREILHYVPHFRDKLFVIAVDGAIAEEENLGNIFLDIALLRSLSIGVALVHGCGKQVERAAAAQGVTPSSIDGTGVTDAVTFELSRAAAHAVTHKLLEGLAGVDLRAAGVLAVIAHPAGILGGVDQQFTGKIERVDVPLLKSLVDRDIVPVIPPLGTDGEGHTFRLNSDAVAVEVALALQAVKVVYLAPEPGVTAGSELQRQLSVGDAEALVRALDEMSPGSRSKLAQAVRATKTGVPRVHIIDGREPEGLLAEVFSHEGIGTLVHANEYQSIRPARRKDARVIHELIRRGVEADELVARSRQEIEQKISDYFLFEVDRDVVGCVALHPYPEESQGELACLFVDPRHLNHGVGGKLVQYVESVARSRGYRRIFCLSTQAFNYFQKIGYSPGTPDDLPRSRREKYDKTGRKSQVLIKPLRTE